MLNLTIKIRPHLQKSSHLVFSPKIAIFALSCKEIRRRRRRNGQAGARPCKRTVGDAGIGTGKASQTADIHQAYKCAGAPLSAQRSLFPRLLFCCPSGAKRGKPTVYHHFAKTSADSPNRKRKDRTKIPGLPELFGQPLSSFISCVTSSRRMIFLPDKASYTSVTCRRLCSSPAPVAGYSEKPCRSNPKASG